MTGTPILNKPIEAWTLLHYLDPGTWRSWWGYVKRYCAAYEGPYGWDVSGASNLPELQRRARETVMIRRLKRDVLAELPPKIRQIIVIEPEGDVRQTVDAEITAYEAGEDRLAALRADVELAKADDDEEGYNKAVAKMRDETRARFTEMSLLRHATALAKLPSVLTHLDGVLDEDPERKVVVFAHHLDVLGQIAARYGHRAALLTGETSQEDRQAAVDRFQADPACRVFVGSLKAAGLGITLTASSHAVFAELDWTPGWVTQAEDRLHRIGQASSVLIQHVVLDGSLDARMAQALVAKQQVINKALDGPADLPALPMSEAATEKASKPGLDKIAAVMTDGDRAAVHWALQMLAALDPDNAAMLNDVGFSKIDVWIGHGLAARSSLTPRQGALGFLLARKYRRQLAGNLREIIATVATRLDEGDKNPDSRPQEPPPRTAPVVSRPRKRVRRGKR